MRALAFLAVLPLAACAVEKGNDNGTVRLDASDNGAVSFDVAGVSGAMNLPKAILSRGKVDMDGVGLPPDAKLTGMKVAAGDGPTKVDIGFTAPTAVAAVRDHYVKAFADKGVTVATAGDTLTGTTKDGDGFTIKLQPEGSGTRGAMQITPRE